MLASRLALFATALACPLLTAAQSRDFTKQYFAGAIGDRRIYAHLVIGSSRIRGPYSYRFVAEDDGNELSLAGTVSSDGEVELTETRAFGERAETATARWKGRIAPDRSRLEGEWSDRAGKKKLPFVLVCYARVVPLVSKQPDVGIGYVEFLDDSELPRLAARAVKEQASARFDEAVREGRATQGDYRVTAYSSRLVSVLATLGGPAGTLSRHESLVFGYKDGEPVQLALADLFEKGAEWKSRLEELVESELKRLDPVTYRPYLPVRVGTFTTLGSGALRFYLDPNPGLELSQREVTIPARAFADLLDPQGPLRDGTR